MRTRRIHCVTPLWAAVGLCLHAGVELTIELDLTSSSLTNPRRSFCAYSALPSDCCARSQLQRLSIEVLEGQRGNYEPAVVGFVDEVLGIAGHMDADRVAQLSRSEPLVSAGLLRVDPRELSSLRRALMERPEVLGVTRREAMLQEFEKQTAGQMRFTTWILTAFAMIIAAGVVYNNARVALSTRSRDLASLRVLGFWRSEVSMIMLGELAFQVLLAIAPGIWLGRLLVERMMAATDPELYHFPAVVSMRTYAFAITVTLVAALCSALVVRNRLDHAIGKAAPGGRRFCRRFVGHRVVDTGWILLCARSWTPYESSARAAACIAITAAIQRVFESASRGTTPPGIEERARAARARDCRVARPSDEHYQ